jgi:hypothetical protein
MRFVIRNRVEKRYGHPVVFSSDCERLSEHIFETTGSRVSAQTLRRVFGFLSGSTQPAPHTLHILANYCGLNSPDDFKQNTPVQLELPQDKAMIQADIIRHFYTIDHVPGLDFNYQNACGNIAEIICNNHALLIELGSFLSQHPIAQVYFFERFPYIDGLAGPYTAFLKNYMQHKEGFEPQLFGNCMLFLGAFLSQNKKDQEAYYGQILALPDYIQYHPFPTGRRRAIKIMQSEGLERRNQIKNAFEEELIMRKDKEVFRATPYYPFIMVEGLNLIKEYESADEMIRIADEYYSHSNNLFVEPGYHECFKMSRAITYFHTGKEDQAKILMQSINPRDFAFTNQKYYSIMHTILERELCSDSAKRKKELLLGRFRELIQQTKYTYFKTHWPA